ncbi:PREDICTED: tripartite motif-containing protein 60-like [Dipodomys ordii]|uniref:Tripartite motif-containing protein 60-like n=1 Tax=Dipodomys ordii TaxID=10020 RepID=A0A1S3FSR1_DIPOR|nr:PREDICTED: tripartite motif-containing protein 60-like [Dipodomys ordii]
MPCGHNFCLPCIRLSWKGTQNTFPCPSCQLDCPNRKFSSNLQLGSLTKIAKLFPTRRSKRKTLEGKLMCKKHKESMAFFCEKDLVVLCRQCCSTNHQHHRVWPIEKAACLHRKQLAYSMELYKDRMERVKKVLALQGSRPLELKRKVERRRKDIHFEFEHLRLFLENRQEALLKQLQEEEIVNLTKLKESLAKTSEHASSVRSLLKEVERKYGQSEMELLTDLKHVYDSYRCLKSPGNFSFTFEDFGNWLPPQYSGLNPIVKCFQADVILDPETAHCRLSISEDRKTVRYGLRQKLPPLASRFFLCPAVLGSRAYNSGRQYWEVDVKDKSDWIVGVCKESLPRRKKNQKQQLLKQDGIWAVGRCSGCIESNYIALGPKRISLLPKVTPSKIGVFLDIEMGEVSFYNLDDRSLLHTYNNDHFNEALLPYFYIGTDSKPLKICTVTDSE